MNNTAQQTQASTCPYCHSKALRYLSVRDINRKTSDIVFHLDQCTECGLLFVTNPPADLGPYYKQGYHYIPKSRAELTLQLPSQRDKIEALLPYKKGGDLLEIGPSVGYFSALAQDAGFDVSAIEMDVDCVRFLSNQLGVRVMQSNNPPQAMEEDGKTYDAICLWHSVEHLPSPWELIEKASKFLKPGGVLLLAAPNPYSHQARMMGKCWPHHDLPRHLFGMSMPWITSVAGKNGLRPLLATTRDQGSLYWNRFSWAMRLCAFFPQNRYVQRLVWMAGLTFGWLMQPWEGKEGEGACYVMIFEKPATS